MSTAKEVVRAIIAIAAAASMFYFWTNLRPEDPDLYKFGAPVIVGVFVFLLLHFIGKGN